MWFKYSLVVISFFVATIMQTSLVPFFAIVGKVPNLIFLLFFILVFFEEKHEYGLGFWSAIIGGTFLDVSLSSYFGISISVFLVIYFITKFFAHSTKDWSEDFSIINFTLLFVVCFVIYSLLMFGCSFLFHFQSIVDINVYSLIEMIYNTFIAVAGFYIGQQIVRRCSNKQLKLL